MLSKNFPQVRHTHTHAHRCYGGKLSSLLFAIGYPSGPFQPLVKMKRLFIKLVFSDIPSVELRAVTAISFISCDESNICGGRRRSQELTQSPAASSAAHTTGAPWGLHLNSNSPIHPFVHPSSYKLDQWIWVRQVFSCQATCAVALWSKMVAERWRVPDAPLGKQLVARCGKKLNVGTFTRRFSQLHEWAVNIPHTNKLRVFKNSGIRLLEVTPAKGGYTFLRYQECSFPVEQ